MPPLLIMPPFLIAEGDPVTAVPPPPSTPAATFGSDDDLSSLDLPDGLADPVLPGDLRLASTDLDLECPAVLSTSDSGDDAYDRRDAIGNKKSSASDSSG